MVVAGTRTRASEQFGGRQLVGHLPRFDVSQGDGQQARSQLRRTMQIINSIFKKVSTSVAPFFILVFCHLKIQAARALHLKEAAYWTRFETSDHFQKRNTGVRSTHYFNYNWRNA